MERYLFLVPLAIIGILCAASLVRTGRLRSIRKKNLLSKAVSLLIPKEGTRLNRFYMRLLRYSGMKLQKLFYIKVSMGVIAMILCVLVNLTNIAAFKKEILEKFVYKTDVIYQSNQEILEKDKALQQEIKYLAVIQKQYGRTLVAGMEKGEAENIIGSVISEDDSSLAEPRALMANKIYYRLSDYYLQNQWPLLGFLLFSLFASIIPEVLLYMYNFFAKSLAKKELRFLKKMMILNGSIKPVDFMHVLSILIEKAKYHREPLKLIEDMNKRNSVAKKDMYYKLIRSTRDINEKLFYEKLEQANCYDFDQAIVNIENDFRIEKRMQARKVRKYIEATHAVGIIMFMLLVMILIIYLLTPWLKAYNTGAIY